MVFSFSFSYFETLDWTYLHFHLPSLLCPSCPEISVQLCGVVCWIILALSFVTAKQLSPLRGTWHSRHLALVDVFFFTKVSCHFSPISGFFSLFYFDRRDIRVKLQGLEFPVDNMSFAFFFSLNQSCLFSFA